MNKTLEGAVTMRNAGEIWKRIAELELKEQGFNREEDAPTGFVTRESYIKAVLRAQIKGMLYALRQEGDYMISGTKRRMNTIPKTKPLFVKGAWLYTLERELSEEEFIEKSGGKDILEQVIAMHKGQYPFLSVVFDDPDHLKYIGHTGGNTIAFSMRMSGHRLYQTMELIKRCRRRR